jgi:hypothetical protein
MKAIFLATAAVAAFATAPALAQDAIGSAGVAYVHSDADGFKTDGAAIDGKVATTAFGDWTVTFDASLNYADNNDAFGDTTSQFGAHVSRLVNGVRVGGFASVQNNEILDIATVGAEAQKVFDQATLTGSVSYSDVTDAEAWNAGVDGAYYPMANLRLNATVGYGNIEAFGADMDTWTYAAGAEYQFDATPYSVFASYEMADFDGAFADVDTFKVGFRYNFGGSLQAQDRAGANIGRATRSPVAVFGL